MAREELQWRDERTITVDGYAVVMVKLRVMAESAWREHLLGAEPQVRREAGYLYAILAHLRDEMGRAYTLKGAMDKIVGGL